MRKRTGAYGRRVLLAAVAALAMASVPVAVAQQPPGAQPPLPGGPPPAAAETADLRIDLDEDHDGAEFREGKITVFEAHVVNAGASRL